MDGNVQCNQKPSGKYGNGVFVYDPIDKQKKREAEYNCVRVSILSVINNPIQDMTSVGLV